MLRRNLPRAACALAIALLLWVIRGTSALDDQHAAAQVPPTLTPPPGVAIERIVPETSTVSVNDPPFIIGVTVEQVSNLGVYEVLLLYDPALLQFNAVANGPFLGSTGRTVFCQPAILTPNFAGTGLTRLAYACNSTGLQPGPSGTGLLAQVQFAPLATGTAVIQLTPSLGDVLGDAIPAISTDGVVTVSPGPTSTPTPTNTPCAGGVCPTNTASPTATAPPVFNCPSPGTALCFEPQDQAIGGVPTSVNVVLAGVNNLGGFEFTVQYEPSVLSFTNITAGPFLGSSGRPVNCVAPQLIPPNKIRLSCVTLGVSPAGASGSGVLATLMFTPIASGASPLSFANATLVAPDASPIAVDESATGSIFVDCGAGCPTLTPTPSPTETPSPTNTLSPTPTFTPLSGGTPCGSCPTPTFTPTIAPNSTIVRVAPTSQSVQELDQFDSFVMIDNVVNLGSFDVQLVYDPTKLQALSIDPGPFLGTGQGQLSCIPTLTAGSARLGCVTLANLDGADGSGQLLKVRFLALAPASATALTLGPVQLTDPSGDSITVHGLQNGTVDVISCGGVCPTFTPTATPGTPTATPTPDGSQTALLFSPGAQTVPLGADFSVDVNVQNVINLGAYQAELEWPPNRFSFVSMQHSSFLGSTGRTVSCQPPIVDVDDIVNPSVVVLRISCNTLGATPPGPSGNALLVRVNLRNTGSGTTAINFSQDSGLSDPAGDDIPSVHLNSALVTTGAPTATHTPLAGGGGFAPAAPPTEDEGRERTSDQPTRAWPNTEHITLAVVGAIIVATAWGRRGIGTALAGAAVGVVIVAAPSMSGGEATASSDAAPAMLAFTLAGDVNDDCRVDVTDEQLMAIRYLAVVGSPLYESRFDVEPAGGDGDIDGRDLQVVLSHDGFDCTTDADGDGCLNAQELGSVPALGGARDPYDEWDFYDVNESRKIDALDIALVRSGYSGSGPVRPEDAIFDRRPGNAPWAPGPPDGRIDAIDIALVRAAYGHSCQ